MKIKKIKIEQFPDLLDGFVTALGKKSKNTVRQIEGGYISYNPDTDCGAETAVVKNDKFLILLGDYRKDYKNCTTILDAIKKFDELVKGGAEVSMWSNYE